MLQSAQTQRRVNVQKVNPWIVAIAVMSSAIMEILDTTVVNVSLQHIAGDLSSTVDEATWVLTSYIVANAVILPLTGWLSSIIGRRRLLLTVITGFTVSSVLCGLAPNLPALILFRILQGTTGGGLQPLSQAVLLEEFPPEKRGKAMSVWALGVIIAPTLGPMLGGWITETYSWRWIFFLNLPIGLLSLFMVYKFVHDPEYIRHTGKRKIDGWGLGMLVIGIASLQFVLDKGQEEDWFSSNLISILSVIAVVVLTAFVIRQLSVSHPIVKFRLLKYRNFGLGIAAITVLGFVLYGSMILLPQFMQQILTWNAVTTGKWMSPRGFSMIPCLLIIGRLLEKGWDGRKLIFIWTDNHEYILFWLLGYEFTVRDY